MIVKLLKGIGLTCISVALLAGAVMAQTVTVSKQAATKWVQDSSWAAGISLKPHASVNAVTFYQQYQINKAVWDKAFQFIREHDLSTIAPGKYPIDGDNAYASITEAPSKELDKASWESHRNYIDLQYVIRGKEQIGVADVGGATVSNPYDAARDVANYTAGGKYYTAEPGTFFLFFPQDAHRPNIKVDGYDVVKKMVIKIKVAK